MFAESQLILGFWPLGTRDPLVYVRTLLDLSQVVQVLVLTCFILGLLITSGVALWRRHFKLAASRFFASMALPVGFTLVISLPLFDPWFWYAMVNSARFERLAASSPTSSALAVECRDVSTGLVCSYNHFVFLFYDKSNAVGLEPSERSSTWKARTIIPETMPTTVSRGKRLYGHMFLVDEFR